MNTPPRDLALLPKAHLHLHLEGSMRPGTLADLATAAGVPAPDVRRYTTFAEFGARYTAAVDLVRTEAQLRRVMREVVEDAAADGAVWVEPSVNPRAHRDRLGPPAYVLDLLLDEARTTADRLGVGCGLMVTAQRHLPPEDAVALALLAASRAKAGVVAFGLATDEARYPPGPFARAFAIAREAGLISAPHAGELAGEASILGAVRDLGADRIGHGVRAVDSPGLMAELAARGTVLDVCPTSNVSLGVVSALPDHPLPRLIEAGVRCTLGADDSLLFGAGLLDEYRSARDVLGLDDARLSDIARWSLEASGAPRGTVADAVGAVGAWLEAPAADSSLNPAETYGRWPKEAS
ncbi:adenosine deaminase [Streptomyces sp. NPDC088729]|uniref:adenosine deaminase n=1 Tax=Streptomyces sp. NPDC088729 TaxID=3365876 RepID=UPI0038083697